LNKCCPSTRLHLGECRVRRPYLVAGRWIGGKYIWVFDKTVRTYTQCAAVISHCWLINEPPQKAPSSSNATCHGHWPGSDSVPFVIR
jgi:hypothetical protein